LGIAETFILQPYAGTGQAHAIFFVQAVGRRENDWLSRRRIEAEARIYIAADLKGRGSQDMDKEEENGKPEEAAEEYEELSDEELNEVIESICSSKAEEFRMLGYEQVVGPDIWNCVSDKYIKSGIPPLYKVVNDILSLKVTQFMNWMTMSIYKDRPFK
jgi:hypothetical protein